MAVNVRKRTTPNGKMYWQADIRLRLPNGSLHRERPKAPGATRAQALRWARQREAHIIRHGIQRKESKRQEANMDKETVPTFGEFVPRFMADHVEANRLSSTTRRHYDVVLRTHLMPLLRDVRLDQIELSHVQELKRRGLKASTTNQLLAKLKTILRHAVEWGVIKDLLDFKRVKEGKRHPEFYDFDVYDHLIAAAADLNPTTHALVLLGGDAGMRRGEIRGLRWPNVYLDRGSLFVCDNLTAQSEMRLPKGGRTRWVPMTEPLVELLTSLDRRGEYVVCRADGHRLSERSFDSRLYRAQQRAGLKKKGPHILRHTFCSHLAMRGTAQKAIQELAGHAKGATTEIYMHLAPRALKEAIRNLRSAQRHDGGTDKGKPEKPKNDQ